MPRGKSRRHASTAGSSHRGGSSPEGSLAADEEQMVVDFAEGEVDYNYEDHSAEAGGEVVRRRGVKSNTGVSLTGPMEVDGPVKAMGDASFVGDFSVRDKIEAYGNIAVNGNVNCGDKIKSYGNVDVCGYVSCGGNVKIFGQLTISGHLETQDDVEVWGAVYIEGYLKCKSLTAYSSVTTIGNDSSYEVEETETIWGARMHRRLQGEADLTAAEGEAIAWEIDN